MRKLSLLRFCMGHAVLYLYMKRVTVLLPHAGKMSKMEKNTHWKFNSLPMNMYKKCISESINYFILSLKLTLVKLVVTGQSLGVTGHML